MGLKAGDRYRVLYPYGFPLAASTLAGNHQPNETIRQLDRRYAGKRDRKAPARHITGHASCRPRDGYFP